MTDTPTHTHAGLDAEVLIIGAGPIGLELAVALKRAGTPYVHVDAGQLGQTVTWYPAQTRFFSSPERIAIAGAPLNNDDQTKATREQYLTYLRSVAQQFDLRINTYERVTAIERDPEAHTFTVTTDRRGDTRAYHVRYVVCAIGDMHGPRKLNIEGEDLPHVSHYFDDPHRYFRQNLLSVGGRNSAAEAALRCHRIGANVTISYRRPEFDSKSIKYWLLPELKSLIKHGHIGFHPCTTPTRITPERVTLAPSNHEDCPPAESGAPVDVDTDFVLMLCPDTANGAPLNGDTDVDADFVLMLTGYRMDTSLLEAAGVNLVGENNAPDFDMQTMQTNVPGLFVAGTAAAGTQVRFRLFIENCHQHVTRIVRTITGEDPPEGFINPVAKQFDLPES